MYAYCFISKDRKGFIESKEGYTYIKSQYENRQTLKVMHFLYGDMDRDMESWHKGIKIAIKKIKLNNTDE